MRDVDKGADVYNLLLPMTMSVCGMTFSTHMEATFELSKYQGEDAIQVLSLSGVDWTGEVQDYLYLIEEGDGEGVDTHIIQCIMGNQDNWNNTTKWW